MKPKRVVVANSVGVDSRGCCLMHSPSRWSQGVPNAKDLFTYYPWELAYLSSLLKRDTDHHVTLVDGCLAKYDQASYRKRLEELEPDFLIMEPATRTLNEDLALAVWAKARFGTKLIFCGPHATAYPEELRAKGVDDVCQGEYEMTVRAILRGEPAASIAGLYPNPRRPLLDVDDLPFPEDDDVRRIDYATPGEPNCEYTEIQMYATRGCPLMCAFCVAQNLYYGVSNHRARRPETIVEELRLLKGKYPSMEGAFFDEEMHNVEKRFILALTSAIRAAGLDTLKYNAMCGHWTLDREMMEAMKSAGYYKIRIGVETADEVAAKGMRIGPKHRLEKLEENLRIARSIGLSVYATFTIGGRGSSREGDRKTGELIRRLVGEGLLRDLQISINTPLPGSPFFEWARKEGYLIEQDWSRFDGGNFAVVSYPGYPKEEIEASFRHALDCYDRGRTAARREPFTARMKETLAALPGSDRIGSILLLRSNRMWQAELAVEVLRGERAHARLEFLAQPAVAEALKGMPGVSAVHLYDRGFFTLEGFRSLFGERLKGGFDAVVVLYNNVRRVGYGECEAVAAEIGGRQLGLLPDGTVVDLDGA